MVEFFSSFFSSSSFFSFSNVLTNEVLNRDHYHYSGCGCIYDDGDGGMCEARLQLELLELKFALVLHGGGDVHDGYVGDDARDYVCGYYTGIFHFYVSYTSFFPFFLYGCGFDNYSFLSDMYFSGEFSDSHIHHIFALHNTEVASVLCFVGQQVEAVVSAAGIFVVLGEVDSFEIL